MSDNLHLAWCRLLARGLAASGVREVVISPGSRSTPLVLGFDAEPALRKHTIIDERAAAFFALGLARSTGHPVALLCTSGTDGAHYLPAVIEAAQAGHPLVIVTADRPWEAYDCGASQTIDQVKLFGDHVRHYAELGLPERAALPAVMRIAAQAVQRATHPAGPVHLNARFRKPLEPVDAPSPEPHDAEVAALLASGPTRFFPADRELSAGGLAALAALCREHERGLLVAGPAPATHGAGARVLRALSERLGYPLCAEVTSQLRQGPAGALDVPSFDALFRSRAFMMTHAPGLIIEIGGPPVSSAYGNWLASRPRVRRVVLAPHGWSDPHGTAELMLEVAGSAWLARLGELDVPARSGSSSWSRPWVAAQGAIEALGVDATRAAPRGRVPSMASTDEAPLSDADVAGAVAQGTPPGGWLLIGNSGPIRDLDAHPGPLADGVRVMHQRGAAGIDGWLAAAAGTASGAGETVVLHLG
ncbi:MAG: 2-succinyl-5-enolpyruvyl-6-hydroxy-3-cyclohexene-1-carboxylic-acid synthase, partial [Myxococcales bacterium]